MSLKNQITFLQELSTNAWPANINFFLNGWIIRLSEGVTKRANSVLPIHYNGQNPKNDIKKVESIYKDMKLPIVFQIPDYTEPNNLDSILDSLGYIKDSDTTVMYTEIRNLEPQVLTTDYNYYNSSQPDEEWFHACRKFNNESFDKIQGKKAIIDRIRVPEKQFFKIKDDFSLIGIALAVVERNYIGVFDVAVQPEYREKGVGTSLMKYIFSWCLKNSIAKCYLQVEKVNLPALGLYKKLGFDSLFNYHYRLKN
ncbi:MAG: GNAT family N-acetyltransferase [Candidatus Hodarchaeales archaeon]